MTESPAIDSLPAPRRRGLRRFFQSTVPERDRVPFPQKVGYGLGIVVEGVAQWAPNSLLTPVMNIGFGMSPALVGLVMMLWTFWSSVTDPVMGNISDNTRTRWGRRRPYVFIGAILTAAASVLVWWAPRGFAGWQIFTWMLLSGLVFYTCYSVWSMPYYTLLLEMTPDYNERTNVTAVRSFIMQFVGLGAGWVFALASLPIFGVLPGGQPDLVTGMRYVSLGLAALIIVFGVIPALFVRERYYQKEAVKQARVKLLPGLKQTLCIRPLRCLFALITCNTFGCGLVSTLGFYVNAYYVCQGDLVLAAKIQGVKATMLVVPNMLIIPICARLAARFGKRAVFYAILGISIVGNLLIFVLYTPAHPWLQIIPPLLIGPASVGLWLLVPSMYADIGDYDELESGKRREGSIMSVASWLGKVLGSVTVGTSGLLLVWTGFDVAHGASQPIEVLRNLKMFYACIPVVFLTLGVFAVRAYSLTHERMFEIRQQLEARRGVI